jgi:hypothetical protein
MLFSGDFTCRGSKEEVDNFRVWMEGLLSEGIVKHVVLVCGNHELSFQEGRSKFKQVIETQREMKQQLMSVPNLHYLEDSGAEVLGVKFYGTPYTLPVNGKCTWAFQEKDTEEDIGKRWKGIPSDTHVVITHSPPYGQGDECAALNGSEPKGTKGLSHGGSKTLLSRIEEIDPSLHIFGHFHEGYGITQREGLRTLFVNAAICDEDYQPDHPPILIEFI